MSLLVPVEALSFVLHALNDEALGKAHVLFLARARVGLAEQAEQLVVLPLALRHLSAGCIPLLLHALHVVAQRRAEQQRVPRLVEVVAVVAQAAGVRLGRRGARAAAVLLHLLGAVGL